MIVGISRYGSIWIIILPIILFLYAQWMPLNEDAVESAANMMIRIFLQHTESSRDRQKEMPLTGAVLDIWSGQPYSTTYRWRWQ